MSNKKKRVRFYVCLINDKILKTLSKTMNRSNSKLYYDSTKKKRTIHAFPFVYDHRPGSLHFKCIFKETMYSSSSSSSFSDSSWQFYLLRSNYIDYRHSFSSSSSSFSFHILTVYFPIFSSFPLSLSLSLFCFP